jgi:ketosteroid isomerase-like protein
MATQSPSKIKRFYIACIIAMLVFLAGCKQQSSSSRPPISAAPIKEFATMFGQLADEEIQAWNSHDIDRIRQLYTEDMVYIDYNTTAGRADLMNTATWILQTDSPQFKISRDDTFMNANDAFLPFHLWNFNAAGNDTDVNPVEHYAWQTPQDGKIAYWRTFYSTEFKEAHNEYFDKNYIDEYAKAWSSGNPQMVADLYTPDTIRQDSLFGEDLQGSTAVKEYATKFFNWYPDVKYEILEPFGESGSTKTMGAIYAIHTSDKDGNPCDVKTAILFEISQKKIGKEWVFYQPDSLIACGWSQ